MLPKSNIRVLLHLFTIKTMSMHKGKCGIWYHEATQAENSMKVNDSYHICQEKLKHSHCTQTDAVL